MRRIIVRSELVSPCTARGVSPPRLVRSLVGQPTQDQRLAAVGVAVRCRTSQNVALGRRGRWFESSRPDHFLDL
jgi:hypothetical protein